MEVVLDALRKGIAPQVNFQPYASIRDADSVSVRWLVSFTTHSKRSGRGVALAGHCGGFFALGDGLAVMGSRWDIQAVGAQERIDNGYNIVVFGHIYFRMYSRVFFLPDYLCNSGKSRKGVYETQK